MTWNTFKKRVYLHLKRRQCTCISSGVPVRSFALSFSIKNGRVYSHVLALLRLASFNYLICYFRYFLRWTESRRVTRAMKQHKSQMVWFRYLYIMFSRYMVINTLRKINLVDIELELEVDD